MWGRALKRPHRRDGRARVRRNPYISPFLPTFTNREFPLFFPLLGRIGIFPFFAPTSGKCEIDFSYFPEVRISLFVPTSGKYETVFRTFGKNRDFPLFFALAEDTAVLAVIVFWIFVHVVFHGVCRQIQVFGDGLDGHWRFNAQGFKCRVQSFAP